MRTFKWDESAVREFERLRKKLDTMRGGGVTNTRDAIVIAPPPLPPARDRRGGGDDGSSGDLIKVRVKVNTTGTGAPTYDLYDFDADVDTASQFTALNLNPDYNGVDVLNITIPLAPTCSRARWSLSVVAADPTTILDPDTAGLPNIGTAMYVGSEIILWDLPEVLGTTTDCET